MNQLHWAGIATQLAEVSDRSRTSMVILGLLALAGGVLLMLRHKSDIDHIFATATDSRLLKFEQRKFRRRSLASTLMAAMGVMMISLNWAREPLVFVTLISVILFLLLAVMLIACFDLMSVSLHSVTYNDKSAQKKMVDEYLRQRKKLQRNQQEESESSD